MSFGLFFYPSYLVIFGSSLCFLQGMLDLPCS
uniref:Uncharacterized protein n=1 Tax=Rhizophora mucronata TaxID=61149 RepID=A0A2P2KXI2_RHIMU